MSLLNVILLRGVIVHFYNNHMQIKHKNWPAAISFWNTLLKHSLSLCFYLINKLSFTHSFITVFLKIRLNILSCLLILVRIHVS